MTDKNFIASGNPVVHAIISGVMTVFVAMIGRLGNSKKSGKALAALVTDSQYINSA